ncbi:hypothetical protein AAHA92_04101 [Salvia divinorum]|uniref:MATH domain-containing protein n=1 Tax=Salvia divinorum TaxID=28513 RepID=A0ABD1HYZ7_SALDI
MSRETTCATPTNLLMKVQSFSSFSKCGIDKFESRAFESGDYKWKMIIYPNGYYGDDDNISVYFYIADTYSLTVDSDFKAIITFYIYNQKKDKYSSFRGTARFNVLKTKWGISKVISKKTLMDPSNGYVRDDICVFGAEVFVIKKQHPIGEFLRLVEHTTPTKHKWTIPNFSKVEDVWGSEEFFVGHHKWKVNLHPKGVASLPKGRYMSFFLEPRGFPPHRRVKAEVSMHIISVLNGLERSKTYNHWFTASGEERGFPKFIEIADMIAGGFLHRDCCFVEVEITVQAIAKADH